MPPAIVKNCFSKSGFSTAEPDPSEDDSDAIITEVGQQLHCLQHSGLAGNLTPEEYIDTDQSVETAGDLYTDIIAHVSRETQGDGDDQDNNGDDVDDGDDDCATTSQVSLAEAQTCLVKLKCYLLSQEDTSVYFSHLHHIKNFMDLQKSFQKQSKITDYFTK